MIDFASYAFNKSHAAAYAVVSFQTAYLMHYYPVEFTAAMLNSIKGDSEKVAYYIRFAKDQHIDILPPDINESYAKFTVKGNSIRFGLSAIKNVGENIIDSVVRSRNKYGKFKDLVDFCNNVEITCINKRLIESLIKSGAFDCFGVYRSKLIAVHEKVLESINASRRRNIEGQVSLFSTVDDSSIRIHYPDINEFKERDKLAMEKEMTGLYLSGHPLDEYKKTLVLKTSLKISDILMDKTLEGEIISESKVKDGDKVIIGGIVSELSKKVTKNNDIMAFAKLEDLYASIEVIIFPKILQKFRNLIEEDALLILKGRVSIREEEEPKIICETIEPLIRIDTKKLYILIESEDDLKDDVNKFRSLVQRYKGNIPVYICTKKERKKFRLDRELWIKNENGILDYLKDTFGNTNIKFM
jgi:DNA polymerase-3 subunit alpha